MGAEGGKTEAMDKGSYTGTRSPDEVEDDEKAGVQSRRRTKEHMRNVNEINDDATRNGRWDQGGIKLRSARRGLRLRQARYNATVKMGTLTQEACGIRTRSTLR